MGLLGACAPESSDLGGNNLDNLSGVGIANPIMFVTMVPIPNDFGNTAATFSNHLPWAGSAGRGGDLWILYPDQTLKNLTEAAGFGNDGVQGEGSIAVRNPCVHWDGTKAIFSMVVGLSGRWQIYEITGLGQSDTPTITYVANQPANYNNIIRS